MQILATNQNTLVEILEKLRSKRSKQNDLKEAVSSILDEVKKNGDRALFEFTQRFDGVKLSAIAVSKAEIREAYDTIDQDVFTALRRAQENIEIFHTQMLRKKEAAVESEDGVKVWREFRPIEKIGLYVPGGKASYPSTVLMLATPAKVAGCKEVVMCVPTDKSGTVNSAVLVAADMCGVKKIFKIGGAQAIAAMAYGTESVPKVSKIFGPGNQYVTTAKMLVYGEVDIDMPAGPSEVAVIADESANPEWIAADLLSQLEHGEDSQAVLVTTSGQFGKKVIQQMKNQTLFLSRKKIISQSFEKSFAIVVGSLSEACEIINEYAPEHLEIVCAAESRILQKINNVGSVFLGPYASEPLGDYATGANHTLPTSGFAKMFAPLSTESFGKMIQVQKISQKGIENLRGTVETLARSEGLDAHARAVSIRFKKSK